MAKETENGTEEIVNFVTAKENFLKAKDLKLRQLQVTFKTLTNVKLPESSGFVDYEARILE